MYAVGCSPQYASAPLEKPAQEFRLGPAVGKSAPEFPEGTKTVTGRPISMESLKGKVVLLDFWATWCRPCMSERPQIRDLSGHFYFAQDKVEIIGVGLDEEVKRFEKVASACGVGRTLICDGKGWESPIPKSYNVEAVPALILIDKKGIVRESYTSPEGLIKKIDALLAEK